MHEMSLVRDVIEVVSDKALQAGATRVKTVHLTIGQGRDVVMELFDGVFGYLARGTVCEGAQLDVAQPPYMVRCRDCGMIYHIDTRDQATWDCPRCTSRMHDVVSGMQFEIDRIEVETSRDAFEADNAGRAEERLSA